MKRNDDILVPRMALENRGELLQKAMNAITVANRLLHENQIKIDHEDGEETFNGFVAGGLFNSIELLARMVSEIGEGLIELAEEKP